MKNGTIVRRKGKQGDCFHLLADDGLVLARSVDYASEEAFNQAITALRHICNAPVEDRTTDNAVPLHCPKYELSRNDAGEFRFQLKDAQGTIVLNGPVFLTDYTCRRGIQLVSCFAPEASVVIPTHESTAITGQTMSV